MNDNDPRKLSQERLKAIRAALTENGLAQVANELSDHIAFLDDELTTMQQYYEEFIIPGIEGRSVGAWSDRVVVAPRDGKPYIQDKSGQKIVLG
jgi:hypothetical protein